MTKKRNEAARIIPAEATESLRSRPTKATSPKTLSLTGKEGAQALGKAIEHKVGSKRTPRLNTKLATVIAALEKPMGATIAELMTATGWQAHSVRGAISGALKKKLQLDVTSEIAGDRGRIYRIVVGQSASSK